MNGHVVTELGTTADADTDRIAVNGRPIPRTPQRRVYIALNKPRGYASTLADPHATRLVTELIDLPGKPMLRPVGRLDIESEGLLLLTDDGEFLYRLTHPKFQIEKQYTATVRGASPPDAAIERLRAGVRLDDGSWAKADRARVAGRFPANDTADLELIVHEGRNRLIRRLCAAVGLPVLRLVRTRVAFITTGAIPSGGWRHLTQAEVERLMPRAPAPAPEMGNEDGNAGRSGSPAPSAGGPRPRRAAAAAASPAARAQVPAAREPSDFDQFRAARARPRKPRHAASDPGPESPPAADRTGGGDEEHAPAEVRIIG